MSETEDQVEFNIAITGIGGQGSIMASFILAEAAVVDGIPVLTTGDYGMAQRGGMVTTHLRLGEKPKTPRIPLGSADLLIGCAPSEALRNIGVLKKDGAVVMDTRVHVPVPVFINPDLTYPEFETINEKFSSNFSKVYPIEASDIASEFDNPRVMNTVLLGASFGLGVIPIGREAVLKVFEMQFNEVLAELNKKAFERGEHELEKLM